MLSMHERKDRPVTMADLKQLPQWVAYKLVPKPNGRTDKIPIDPHTGRNASSTNPKTWGTAQEAWAAKNRYGLDGIGFVFTIGTGIVGTDLDDCFEMGADGVRHWKHWARNVVQCVDSYTEYSPSRIGAHILAFGEIPYSITKNKIGFEMYNEARFFTVTGWVIGDVQEIHKRPNELLALHATFEDAPRSEAVPSVECNSGDILSKEAVKAMLDVIPVHQDYLDWLRCLMAVHDAYPGHDGVAMIEDWSPGYRGEVANKFRSFDRTAKDGVSVATLVYMANQHGHRPATRSYVSRLRSHASKLQRLMAV